jgi:FHS family L-fucose permease-like MFS transporter
MPNTVTAQDARAQANQASRPGVNSRALVWLVIGLFFVWGGATSLNDILIPKLKGLFQLSYAEVMLTQFAFFTAYFLVSLPAGTLVARVGYVRGLVIGLGVMVGGALLFWVAAGSGVYASFLVALFVLAAGITILQVASNPLITTLGDPAGASGRLTFAQAFNSLGTTVWPYIGALLILGTIGKTEPASLPPDQLGAFRASQTTSIGHIYLGIGIVLAIIAAIFWTQRNVLPLVKEESVGFFDSVKLLRQPRVLFGTVALFVYVGAEVSIGSILASYLQLSSTLHVDAQTAGERLSFYWGGAMVGRFIGSWLLNRVTPGTLLTGFAVMAGVLVLISMTTTGVLAGWSLIAVGLFNSIMFPTVFSLASEGQGSKTPQVSGLLCMAIVGGAIVPLITGTLADATSIATALVVPVLCYAVIAAFGLAAIKPLQALPGATVAGPAGE